MQKRIFHLSLICAAILISVASCKQKSPQINLPKTDLAQAALIPMPTELIANHNGFALDRNTVISSCENEAYKEIAQILETKIEERTGLTINSDKGSGTVIHFLQTEKLKFDNEEAYQIKISEDTIKIESATAVGAFRAIQTIRQLIPTSSNDTLAEYPIWVIPTGEIYDAPQFAFRGTMLDVSRHFFSVEDVKKYIDLLSYYKINMLHLHLSDDQGWRIEIKSWPKLTEIGGSTEVGGESGGFYTQEDYKELVQYAADHHITIIPEIDMPGHTNAASVSYPFLNGNGKKPELYEGIEVGFSTFDTRKDSVYMFIDDVIREISAITPGPYFHIGGDESHVTKKEDFLYFINRVEKIVSKYGKQMIGWDEIAKAEISSNSISQFWRSEENAKLAESKKIKLIISTAKKAYLDMKYDSLSKHGLHWAGYIPVDTGYIWSPEAIAAKENILGIEAPLWSETISNISELEYLAFPRVIGYAELGWSIPENRDWNSYRSRLAHQAAFLQFMNVNYYPSPLIDWESNN
jgi:hexosaminidase